MSRGADSAPNSFRVKAGLISAQPVVLAPVAAAAISGGGMREQPVNLVHGVPVELASSSNSSASVPVASNMLIIHCEYTFVKGAYFTC